MLDPNDDIVIHCSNPLCPASIIGYQILEHNGYKKIKRYAGGLQDWEEAGYPLEGSLVGQFCILKHARIPLFSNRKSNHKLSCSKNS